MKELSVEEKAKRYDEAINTIRILVNAGLISEDAAIQVFPEIAETEDERIRKALRERIIRYDPNNEILIKEEGISQKQFLTWLEKQEIKEHDVCDTCEEKASCVNPCPIKLVEQKPADVKTTGYWNVQDVEIPFGAKNSELQEATYYIPKGFHAEIEGNNVVIKKGEKPIAWSEEDEYYLNSCITKIEIDIQNWEGHGKTMIDGDKDLIAWLKSLKDRVLPQPKQEWSEEDNSMLISIENILIGRGHSFHDKEINWLKSLRPQLQWKPSKEQMDMLAKVCSTLHLTSGENEIMESIYDALNKLREK